MESPSEWGLWVDWCVATGRDPTSATWADVERFVIQVPAAPTTVARRLGAIRAAYARTYVELVGAPDDRVERLWSRSAEPQLLSDRLAALPGYGWPHAVRGRRDAVILLLAAAGCSRAEIARTRPDTVAVWIAPALRGQELPRAASTYACPACALTRWLRVLSRWSGPYGLHAIEQLVEATPVEPGQHDCQRRVEPEWESAPWLVCRILAGGLLTNEPVGLRAITTAVREHDDAAAPGSLPSRWAAVSSSVVTRTGPYPRPVDRAPALREIDDLLDQLDAALEALGIGRAIDADS